MERNIGERKCRKRRGRKRKIKERKRKREIDKDTQQTNREENRIIT